MYTMGSTWEGLSKRSWTWCLTLCSLTSGPGWLGFAPWLWGQICIALLSRSSPEHSSTWDRTLLSASPRPHFHVTSGSFSHWWVPFSQSSWNRISDCFLILSIIISLIRVLLFQLNGDPALCWEFAPLRFHFPLVVLHTKTIISLRLWCILGGCNPLDLNEEQLISVCWRPTHF